MRAETNCSLAENFLRYFDVRLALTRTQQRAACRIRYRVYCEEFGYEPAERFPAGEETDEYDARALACLVTHRPSGMPAGCVRMIPAEADRPLPLERYCGDSLDRMRLTELGLDRARLCEISRLAVDGAFRRRAGEAASRFGEIEALGCSPRERRTFPLIAVALFLATAATSEASGRVQGLAMMEPFLPRLMRRSGVVFHPVGREVNYHGLRAPYFSTLEEVCAGMRPELRAFYAQVRTRILEDYARLRAAA